MYMPGITKRAILIALGIGLAGVATTASAAVVLLNESRSVTGNATVSTQSGSDSVSSTRRSLGDFADFDESIDITLSLDIASASSQAHQQSQIGTSAMTGSGTVASSAELTAYDPQYYSSANASAGNSFSVTFAVTEAHFFDLTGMVSSLYDSGSPYGSASVSLRNQANTYDLSFSTPYGGGQTPFDVGGTLFPDTYVLQANASMNAFASYYPELESGMADFIFDFNVTPVPVPAAVWLFGSGLVGLIGIARRKQAS